MIIKLLISLLLAVFVLGSGPSEVQAQARFSPTASPSASPEATVSAEVSPSPEPTASPLPRVDITQQSEETISPLQKLLREQHIGRAFPWNPLKYAIRAAVDAGVPANTIVLLLLLPMVAAVIAAARHIVGLRGFGIFLPAALSVVFVATGPVVGLILFLIIVTFSYIMRFGTKAIRFKLQYLPRMALTLWFVVIGVLGLLFAAPVVRIPGLTNVSIFPVLILVLLAEDFTKVQLGKSAKTAINMTIETLILALLSFIFLTMESLQRFALLNPELLLVSVAVFNVFVGKFVGLRFLEYWRYRKLIWG